MWETEQGGGLYATGVGGGIIGYPADTLLLDDLLKGWQAAHSKGQRELVWDIYKSQCRMRMQSFLSPIIACGTRWHELDHFRRLVENEDEQGDQWKIVRLPTVAEAPDPTSTDPILRLADPLDREPGELLEPERFEEREVRARFSALGSYLAAAMEQQRPAAEEGTEIKRSWFHVDETMPQHFDSALTSWDMKLKDKETDDYNVGQVWFRTGTDFWLMDQIRGKWGQAVTRVAVALLAVRWPDVKRHVIESAGFGPEVIQSLKEKSPKYVVSDEVASLLGMNEDERVLVQALIRRGLPGVVGNTVKGSKSVRMRAEAPLVEAGNVHLPAHATFTPPFLDECAAFPNGANDDQVDAFSQALSKLSRSSGRVQRPPKRQLVTPAPADIAQPIARPTRRRRAVRVIGPRRPRSPYG